MVEMVNNTKKCKRCNSFYPFENFRKDTRLKCGLRTYCITCENKMVSNSYYKTKEYHKAYNKMYEDKRRDFKLKERYGINLEEYNRLFAIQNGMCALCNREETSTRNNKPKLLAVDHCHKTGKVRGLLCQNCNTALGLFNDSIEILEKAKKYLVIN